MCMCIAASCTLRLVSGGAGGGTHGGTRGGGVWGHEPVANQLVAAITSEVVSHSEPVAESGKELTRERGDLSACNVVRYGLRTTLENVLMDVA